MNRQVSVYPDMDALCRAGAEILAGRAREAVTERDRFTMAVNGGSSAAGTLRLFFDTSGIDWKKVYVFWGDDRFVPVDHEYSNYRLLKELFPAGMPAANIIPVPTHHNTPEAAALDYERILRSFFKTPVPELPVFDCAFNGMGPDGHTASIFPGSPEPEPDRLVTANPAGMEPLVDRVTLTEQVFNNSRLVLFSVGGEAKKEKAFKVLAENNRLFPAARIRPADGDLIWLLDAGAGALLPDTILS